MVSCIGGLIIINLEYPENPGSEIPDPGIWKIKSGKIGILNLENPGISLMINPVLLRRFGQLLFISIH